ncbi:hypothetical protein FB451DRAFT_1171652 [Mycena latifolia]|nr:hypothetical protein FB451DRAFT_1171652 [Mycena latifolia]
MLFSWHGAGAMRRGSERHGAEARRRRTVEEQGSCNPDATVTSNTIQMGENRYVVRKGMKDEPNMLASLPAENPERTIKFTTARLSKYPTAMLSLTRPSFSMLGTSLQIQSREYITVRRRSTTSSSALHLPSLVPTISGSLFSGSATSDPEMV